MYQVGDLIIYGGDGVCRVEKVGPGPFSGQGAERTYYTLKPCYGKGVIYAPTDVGVPMRPVLTKEEAWDLIRSIPHMEADPSGLGDARQAAQVYKSLLQTYDNANLIRLIRLIYRKNQAAITRGRGYGHIDERFLKRAKDLLHGELAIALDIPLEQVEDTIAQAVAQESTSAGQASCQ